MAKRRSTDGENPDYRPLIRTFLGLPPQAQIVIAVVAILVIGIVAYERSRPIQAPNSQPTVSASIAPPTTSTSAVTSNMLLGNPSGATADPANRDNFLMVKPYYALSYNDSAGSPNWVSWRVDASDLGDAPRKRTFDTDMTLPVDSSGF